MTVILTADIRTIILLLWMGNLIAVALLAVRRRNGCQRYPFVLFLGARLAQALAWILLWLRGDIPNVLSVWLGNTCLFAGWAWEALALLSMRQRRRSQDILYWTAAALSVPVNLVLYSLPSPNIQVAVASVIPLALFLLPALHLTLEKHVSLLQRVVGGLYLVFSLATSYRSVAALTAPGTFSLLTPGAAQSFAFLALFWLMLFGAVGYLLLLNEHADQALQQKEATYRALNATLAQQVAERTDDLQTSIEHLEDEIGERMRIEAELRQSHTRLAQRLAEHSQKLTALYEVILLGGQALDEPLLISEMLGQLASVAGNSAAAFWQQGEDKHQLELMAQRGLPEPVAIRLTTLPVDWFPLSRDARADLDLTASADLPLAVTGAGFGASLSKWVWFSDYPLGLLCAFWPAPQHFSVEEIALFGAVVDQFGVILENGRLRQRVTEDARLQERRRVARDLHDSVTQSLHSLSLSAATARRLAAQGQLPKLDQILAQLDEGARQALKETRLLLFELRLAPLAEINLLEAVRMRLESVERRAGIAGQVTLDGSAGWPEEWNGELYPIIMEALNNALRHAHAGEVRVRLSYAPPAPFELEVSDNGGGFDPQATDAGGQGLPNLAARAAKLGGRLNIVSEPGAGTRVSLRVEAHA